MSVTLQAPHATPRKSLGTGTQKIDGIGWLSSATYESLPPRIQLAARTLQKHGEIKIEGHYDEAG